MNTPDQAIIETVRQLKRLRRSLGEKLRIVEETVEAGRISGLDSATACSQSQPGLLLVQTECPDSER